MEEVTSVDKLEAARDEWVRLWERTPYATPFQSPEWLLPWWRNLFGGGRVWILALRYEGVLVGLAQFFIWRYPLHRTVSLAGSGVTDCLDLLLEPDAEADGSAAIVDYLRRHASEWDICDWQEIRGVSPLSGLDVPREICSVCPVLPLPRDPGALHTSLTHKFRTDLRRTSNRLQREGNITFELATGKTLDEFLEALFELHFARWRERHESGVLASERLRRFHREAARELLRRGWLRMHGLRVNGCLAAVQYNFAARGRTYAYLSGFDPAFARYSPGMVLLGHSIEHAIGEGCTEFDFLRKPEDFKYQWGARDQFNSRMTFTHDCLQRAEADRAHADAAGCDSQYHRSSRAAD